jgi:PHD/YefM family antitoxin component YafN of YafNO toxin-antitoxin module
VRFNIAKTIETIYSLLNNANKEKARDLLNKFEAEDEDFDVHFYSQKALKNISN